MCGVCVECLIGKQNKPTLFKVTEPSSVPYRAPSASRFSETTLSCIVNISRNKRFSVYRGRHALNHTSLAPREYRQQHMLLLGLALRSFLGLPENMFDHRVKIWPLHRNCFRGPWSPCVLRECDDTEFVTLGDRDRGVCVDCLLLERSPSHVPQANPRKGLLQRCVYHEPRTSHGHTHALVSLLYYPHTPQLRSTRYVLLHAVHHLPSPRSFRSRVPINTQLINPFRKIS